MGFKTRSSPCSSVTVGGFAVGFAQLFLRIIDIFYKTSINSYFLKFFFLPVIS